MKIFGITKHLNRGGRARILALSLFILILSVFSCANDAVIDDFTNPAISDSAEKIIFSGSLNIEGAVPGALSKISNESEVTGRSAFPSVVTSETSDVKYYISARATGPEGISEEIKGSVDQTAKSYSIGLTIGRTYTVTASLKKTLTDGQQITVMEAEWENVTPSRTNTSLTHDFILKPVKEGNGSIKLEMTLPTGIDCPRLSDVSGDIHLSVQFKDTTTTTSATITGSDITAGTYNITINFYKSSRKFLLYSIPQTINVFAGMETNTWQDDGSSNSPISAGKFVLTDEIIKNYQRTIFYVSEKDFTGKEIPDGQTRTGSPYAPFASLSDALNTIANNNKAEDYKIFIGGSLTGNTQISTLIKAENAKSLIIEGFTGNSSDCLVGDGSSSVLTVGSSVPLTIKNLKISGGNAEKGGGINIGENAVVFLGNDLIITDNTASGLGGGVYAPNGVNVEGNLVITENTDSSGKASNLYLPAGKCVNVKGALTKGSEKAKIGISTADEPSLTNKVTFTLDYGKYNSSVAPGIYFTGDKWSVTAGSCTAAGEACLAASGGNIIIEPVYEDIQISADKTSFAKDTVSKVITFTAKGVNSEGQQVTLPIGTGEGEVSLTYSVSSHGETIPEESGSTSYYTTDTDTLTLGDVLPLGEYMVSLTAIYNGKTYSASFMIAIEKYLALPSSYSDIESGKTYAVADSSAIKKLAEFSNAGYSFSGVTLKLSSDVTINTAWTPVGNATAFSGTFDGDENTVTFAPGTNAEAFFGTVKGNVKNLKVAGSTSVAGIAKEANSSTVIENCENLATVSSSTTQEYCAGIVAYVQNNATIKGCVNSGSITSNFVLSASNTAKGAGGIVGFCKSGGIIDSCVNTGSVTGPNAGGITSCLDSTNSTIRNACNSGNITSTGLHAGGICAVSEGSGGGTDKASHIYNCFNSGSVTVTGTKYVGYAGGIVGHHGWGNTSWAQNCLNIGNVSKGLGVPSGSRAGALFGYKDSWSQIDFCYYKDGCADPGYGIGGSLSDTENQCIKAAQAGTNNAVISAEVTLNGTAYSADTSTVLSLLNAWVSANNADGSYCEWETGENHWPKLKIE